MRNAVKPRRKFPVSVKTLYIDVRLDKNFLRQIFGVFSVQKKFPGVARYFRLVPANQYAERLNIAFLHQPSNLFVCFIHLSHNYYNKPPADISQRG